MGRCSYTWEEWDREKFKKAKKHCEEETWEDSDEFCIFHDPLPDKDPDLFRIELEKKLEKKDYNFTGFIIPLEVYFYDKKFDRNVNFRGATFYEAGLGDIIFEKDVYFNGAIFYNAFFVNTSFQNAYFTKTTFYGNADFIGATFQDAYFRNTIFCGNANFKWATFQNAYFSEATFQHVSFTGAVIERNIEFTPKENKQINFRETQFLFKGQINANLTEARFQKADLENVNFIDCNWPKSKSLFRRIFGPNTCIYEEKHMKDENLSFKQLEAIYRNLKLSMQRHGHHSESGEFFYREMECRKEVMREKKYSLNRFKSYGYSFLKYTCGYGETPDRVISTSLLIIIVAALLFMFNGISIEKNAFERYTVDHDLIEIYNAINNHDLPSISSILKNLEDFFQCFYHSVVTFTTLGYGDIHPIGILSKSIACLESFLGALFMALFVLVLGRKMIR
jgi:uncharacterized protein YjbI with pentapeptide repeats